MFYLFRSLARSYNDNNQIAKGVGRFFEPIVIYIRDEIAIPSIGEESIKSICLFCLPSSFLSGF